jgi:hypothetical protein
MRERGNWDDANNLQNISKAITFRDQVRHDSAFDGYRDHCKGKKLRKMNLLHRRIK